MQMQIYKAESRHQVNQGWFRAAFSFSFGRWDDPARRGFGALRVLNDSVIQPGTGFPRHSHDNFEIVTIQLQGTLSHTDDLSSRLIKGGDVQVITAGKGVTHSDLNIGPEEAKQLQVWLLPGEQDLDPTSAIQTFSPDGRENHWQTLVSPRGYGEGLSIAQQAWFSRGHFRVGLQPNYTLHHPGNGLYLFLLEGQLTIGENKLFRRDTAALRELAQVSLEVTQTADVLLIEVPLQGYE
jgi:hypothetical protein